MFNIFSSKPSYIYSCLRGYFDTGFFVIFKHTAQCLLILYLIGGNVMYVVEMVLWWAQVFLWSSASFQFISVTMLFSCAAQNTVCNVMPSILWKIFLIEDIIEYCFMFCKQPNKQIKYLNTFAPLKCKIK